MSLFGNNNVRFEFFEAQNFYVENCTDAGEVVNLVEKENHRIARNNETGQITVAKWHGKDLICALSLTFPAPESSDWDEALAILYEKKPQFVKESLREVVSTPPDSVEPVESLQAVSQTRVENVFSNIPVSYVGSDESPSESAREGKESLEPERPILESESDKVPSFKESSFSLSDVLVASTQSETPQDSISRLEEAYFWTEKDSQELEAFPKNKQPSHELSLTMTALLAQVAESLGNYKAQHRKEVAADLEQEKTDVLSAMAEAIKKESDALLLEERTRHDAIIGQITNETEEVMTKRTKEIIASFERQEKRLTGDFDYSFSQQLKTVINDQLGSHDEKSDG